MKSYIFHINFYDLGILGTMFTGLTLALLLWCGKGINRTANRFLALALGIVVLWMIRVLGVDVCLDTYFPGWGLLPLQYSLALGPLLYFWVLKLTRVNRAFRNADALHFLPLLFELGAYILEVAESLKTGTPVYNTPIYERLNPLLLFFAFASVTVYLYLCYRLVESFYKEQIFTGGDRYRRGLRWLQSSLAGFGLVWLLWIPFTALNFFLLQASVRSANLYPAVSTILICNDMDCCKGLFEARLCRAAGYNAGFETNIARRTETKRRLAKKSGNR